MTMRSLRNISTKHEYIRDQTGSVKLTGRIIAQVVTVFVFRKAMLINSGFSDRG